MQNMKKIKKNAKVIGGDIVNAKDALNGGMKNIAKLAMEEKSAQEQSNEMEMLDKKYGIKRTQFQHIIHALCESGPATAIVLTIVFLAITQTFTGYEAPIFETFVTVFFIIEQSIKIYGMTPKLFFKDKFCCMDFAMTNLDIVGIVMNIAMAGSSAGQNAGQIAKSGRALRVLRVLRVLRSLRSLRVLKVFVQVFSRARTEHVELRKKEVQDMMKEADWEVDRKEIGMRLLYPHCTHTVLTPYCTNTVLKLYAYHTVPIHTVLILYSYVLYPYLPIHTVPILQD
jgi:hypothetical protein